MDKLMTAIILKKIPLLSVIVKYFTDPDAVGKRRTIVTALSTIAAGLIAAKGLIAFVCQNAIGKFALAACSVDVEKLAAFIAGVVSILNQPEVGAVGFASGIYALAKAYKKEKSK
jgi:hypothetical protein